MRVCRLVAALAGERVIDVRDRDYLGGYRNPVAGQTVRISASVKALMVPARNLIRVADERLILADRYGIEYVRTLKGVGLYYFKFLRQWAELSPFLNSTIWESTETSIRLFFERS